MRNLTRSASLALAVAFALPAAALAQVPPGGMQPPTSKGVVIKGRAPVSDEVLKPKLPRPQEADLANGLHLIVLEDHRVPQINFSLIIPGAGGYYDPADQLGLASMTAAMMREGTTTRTTSQISEQLETMSAGLQVNTGMATQEASLFGSCLTENMDRLFDLAADLLLHPTFPEEELAKYKQRTLAGLMQQRSNPGFLGNEMFSKVMYGNHPAARVAPTADAVNATTRASLAAFHKGHYVPDHAALAISGDITLADARRLVEQKFAAWAKAGTPMPGVTEPPAPGAAAIYLIDRPTSVQTNFTVGTPGIDRMSPDYNAVEVMNKIIGGGPTGRLFIHLREDKGYTYGAYSGFSAGRFRGTWSAGTDVRSEVTEPALRDLLAEITTIRDTIVPAKEFRDQQRSLVASFALSLESPAQMLNYYVTSWRYHLPAEYWDRYPERVMAVTPVQVQTMARKYLAADRIQIVAVGDGTKMGAALGKFGQVHVFDTEGKPKINP
jgi:zinc protease